MLFRSGYPFVAEEPGQLPHVELYDDVADPNNLCDLAADPTFADIRRDLDDRLWRFLFDTDDFIIHDSVWTDWQQETRRQMEAWCARVGQPAPRAVGPAIDPCDRATKRGEVSAEG